MRLRDEVEVLRQQVKALGGLPDVYPTPKDWHLKPLSRRLLHVLMARPGPVVSHDQLHIALYGVRRDGGASSHSIYECVEDLNRVLKAYGFCVDNTRGIGYSLSPLAKAFILEVCANS